MRWLSPHGQSKAIHFGLCLVPTKTATRDGSSSGISSAASTIKPIFHRRQGSQGIHSVQENFIWAKPCLGRAQLHLARYGPFPGGSNGGAWVKLRL